MPTDPRRGHHDGVNERRQGDGGNETEAMKRKQPQRNDPLQFEDDDLLDRSGRGLGLRLLALLGALSFVMLGLTSLTPLLYPEPTPQPIPRPTDPREAAVS